MGKGSGRRPQEITDQEMEDAWNAIFAGHPNEDDFAKVKKNIVKRKKDVVKEDDYGNVLPGPNDPDKYVDDLGDA